MLLLASPEFLLKVAAVLCSRRINPPPSLPIQTTPLGAGRMAVMDLEIEIEFCAIHFPSRNCHNFPACVPAHKEPSESSASETIFSPGNSNQETSSAAATGSL